MQDTLKLFNQNELQVLTESEEKNIFRKINSKSRERIIYAHARLVVKIAQRYEGCGLDLEDLVSEGFIGLLKAIDHFDPKRGAKFSYYCSFWVKQVIIKALANKGRLIRLPAGVTSDFLNILKFKSSELGKQKSPTIEEISGELGLPLCRVKNIYNATRTVFRLDHPKEDSGSKNVASVGESIEDERATSPSMTAGETNDASLLLKYFNKLNKRERLIIANRFGLGGEEKWTLQKLSEKLSLSRERVRQIEEKTLLKLREMFEEDEELCRKTIPV